MKYNVLVTGIGGDIGQNIIKCLQEKEEIEDIIGCDIDKYAAGRAFIKNFEIAPRVDNILNYYDFIKKTIEKYKVKYIIPSTENEIKILNENMEMFNKIGAKILINNNYIVDTFLDKFKTIEFFEKNNIQHPKTYKMESYYNQLNYPFIFKLNYSAGSKGVFVINNNEELEKIKLKYKEGLFQEMIGTEEEEYTIGVFSDGEEIYSIAFRRYLGLGSLSKFVELINDEKIQLLAIKIAKEIKLCGSINIQARKLGEEYIPFEINPRLSSTLFFRNYFGFQDLKWWLDVLEGKNIKYERKYKRGIGVRTVGEVFFDLQN